MWNCYPSGSSSEPGATTRVELYSSSKEFPYASIWKMEQPSSLSDVADVGSSSSNSNVSALMSPNYDTASVLSQVASALEKHSRDREAWLGIENRVLTPTTMEEGLGINHHLQQGYRQVDGASTGIQLTQQLQQQTQPARDPDASRWDMFMDMPNHFPSPEMPVVLPISVFLSEKYVKKELEAAKKRRCPQYLVNQSHLNGLNNQGNGTDCGDMNNESGTEDEEHCRRRHVSTSDSSSVWSDGSSTISQVSQASVWNYDIACASFSKKVFIGGLPCKRLSKEIIQDKLQKEFNPMLIQWHHVGSGNVTPGFAHLIFRHVDEVLQLIRKCKRGDKYDGLFYKLSSSLIVEIIPWDVRKNRYAETGIEDPQNMYQPTYHVFVAGLHGMSSAQDLYNSMTEMFGNVVETSLETDKYGYPLGMGRVAFSNKWSYLMAINKSSSDENLVEISERRVLIEPYLHQNVVCSICEVSPGPFFCRNFECLRYYCITCFREQHKALCIRSSSEQYAPERIYEHRIMFKDKTRVQKEVSDSILSSIYHEGKSGWLE